MEILCHKKLFFLGAKERPQEAPFVLLKKSFLWQRLECIVGLAPKKNLKINKTLRFSL
jgi:hypothetical protein